MRHVLIANRAAIAVRAAETCRRMGLVTTALTAASDPQDSHAAHADHRITVDGWGMPDTYDSVERVLDATMRCGADTVYPGYGALAENAGLAARLEDAGIRFVGPASTALARAGDKQMAIEVAEGVGIPVLPHCVSRHTGQISEFAERTGWPVILKPLTGYGGQGVGIARSIADVAAYIEVDDQTLWYAEKFLDGGRVVGVSLAKDAGGAVIQLGERESLLVAGGLKLLEASPVLGVEPGAMALMRDHSERIVRALDLSNVVTVEFVTSSAGFYFIEVNGRLPLAYRMSEIQCGMDIIELQLRIARGELVDPGLVPDRSLHCLEARVFIQPNELEAFPRVGTFHRVNLVPVSGVTYACTVQPSVPAWYELIVAQALASGSSRDEAGRRLLDAVLQSEIDGVKHFADEILELLDVEYGEPGGTPRLERVCPPKNGTRRPGLLIAFLGIDGIGKSTLCRSVEERLRAEGHEVVSVAWRTVLDTSPGPWPAVALQQLWLESFRCLYGGGHRRGATIDLPRDYPGWIAGECERFLAEEPVHDNSAAGALAAAFVEIAGNVILAAEITLPLLRRGVIVLQESYPLKHVLKELAVARELASAAGAGGEVVADLARVLSSSLESIFTSGLLRPDIGLLVNGRPADAYRWRTAQNGRIGALEDYGPAGERSEESFLRMQEETASLFRHFANRWHWLRHEVDGSGVEANTKRGLTLLLKHPTMVTYLESKRTLDI